MCIFYLANYTVIIKKTKRINVQSTTRGCRNTIYIYIRPTNSIKKYYYQLKIFNRNNLTVSLQVKFIHLFKFIK